MTEPIRGWVVVQVGKPVRASDIPRAFFFSEARAISELRSAQRESAFPDYELRHVEIREVE